jgi:signal transduction histidine kinase
MSRRVEAFLLMSRNDSTEAEKRLPVTVNQVVGEILTTALPELKRRNIDFAFDEQCLLKVLAVPELVSTVVRNLIQNAVRYTTGGKISITITQRSFIIEDSGPGISDEVIERAFKDYVRVNSSHPLGNGMGLVIIKRICSYNKWGLSISGGKAGGSKISLEFIQDQLVQD